MAKHGTKLGSVYLSLEYLSTPLVAASHGQEWYSVESG